jgi:hydroxyethylthiazole kinase-like uncharacterized protein yjeF
VSEEILTVSQMREADLAAVRAGTPGLTLMERAGAAVATALTARFERRPCVVLCGPGSNGGDGYVVARRLRGAGWPVRVAGPAVAEGAKDAHACAEAWGEPPSALSPEAVQGAGLVVDALYGAGLSRPLDPASADVLRAVKGAGTPLVSVDLPSGLHGDTAKPLGYAPHADLTVTFHRLKPAHVLQPGRALCGKIVLADIGLPAPPAPGPDLPLLVANTKALWSQAFPRPAVDGFKSRRGHLMILSGGAAQTGAARLACRGGLRVGAGLVTLLSPPGAVLVNATHLEAVMLTAVKDVPDLLAAVEKANAVVIGPAAGVGELTRRYVEALAQKGLAMVVDADALTSFKTDPEALFALLTAKDVLTPHPGEFERVFPGLLETSMNRIVAARAAAARSGAVVLLKGADTVIAAPDGRCAVNINGSPWLATAGSGDVLAGLIGGLRAQGLEAFLAACAGAWIHAAAAESFGPGLISEDLPGLVPGVLTQILDLGTPEELGR